MTKPPSNDLQLRKRLRGGMIALLLASSVPLAAASAQPVTASCHSACAPTQTIEVGNVRYAYRAMGPEAGVPMVLLNRFRGTMDEWDPTFIDALSRSRRVIIFDNVGVARTNGKAPPKLTGWAQGAGAFIDALGLKQVDLVGFSFGGLVSQQLTLERPELVRRLVILGSGAGYVEGYNLTTEAVRVATKPVNDDADFLFLFFRNTPTSQAAGRVHLARLKTRSDAFKEVVSAETWQAMLAAGSDVGTAETSLLKQAHRITQPALVANGVEDIMIPTYQSYALVQALPNGRLSIYPDSGHAFMFQYPAQTADEIVRFLSEGDKP